MWRALTLASVLVFLAGCGGAKPSTAEQKLIDNVNDLQAHADKVVSNIEAQEAAEKKLRDDLQADPTPVADLALTKARAGYATQFGDDAAKTAQITVDSKTIKTFGGEKWTVRGAYVGKDKDGADKSATWEATVNLLLGKLSVMRINLDASE